MLTQRSLFAKKRSSFAVLRLAAALLAAVILVWALLPTTRGVVNAGVIASVIAGLGLLCVAVGWPLLARWWHTRVGKVVLLILLVLVVVLLVLFIVASSWMVYAAAQPASGPATVVVLGAGLQGDQPSTTLADRLDAATKYLEAYPEAACIVTGGQGPDEVCTEASVMYAYLVSKGIDPTRIYQEDQSTNTQENLRYAGAIIEREGLDGNVVIATQEFHQYRAQKMAEQAGLTVVGPVTCRSHTSLLLCYWVREFAAVCRFWLLG